MKLLMRFGCLAAAIYLQSCGGSMIKHDNADTGQKPVKTSANHIKIPVPKATSNLVIKDEKDLTGYWVGMFEPDTAFQPGNSVEDDMWEYQNKINVSIDEINGEKVNGHSVVAGNFRPFTGTVKKDGPTFRFSVKEPGDDKYDGAFKFSITTGDSVLSGKWKADGKVRIPLRKYNLQKELFHYNPNLKLEEGKYIDWNKKQKGTVGEKGGSEYREAFFTTSNFVNDYNASTDLMTKEEAANLKQGDLIILRNAIYARHGYSFKNIPLRAYFDQQDWYIPISTDVRSDLTAIEKKNIELLKRYEKNAAEFYDVFGR